MLLSADQVAALLKALGLTQSIFKPIPDIVRGLTELPLIGGIFEADKSFAFGNTQTVDTAVLCNVEPYDPPPVVSQTFPPFDQAKANIFRYRQQQSVNLGSWFVHEQWMTPSLFTCASGPQTAEIDIASGWGNTTASRAILERHWDTFINQSDFEYLASIGINTVRLPIGYWSLGPFFCQGTPFQHVAEVYTNSWSRVVRAINWAGEAGIGVLVDLHGAVGSQNGQSHSGISDGQVNLFKNVTYQDLTISALAFLTQQLASVTNVVGIEILNEPVDDPKLPDFYTRAITTMRQTSKEAVTFPLYIHDAFNLGHYSDFVSSRLDFVVEDHHSYFVFDPEDISRNATQESDEVQDTVSSQLSLSSQKQRRNLVIGEWSCALVPSSLAGAKDPVLARQQFCQGQEQVYSNTTGGWHFWSYMKEGCDTDLDWCFKNAVGKTLPSSFFSYNSSLTSPSKSASFVKAVAEMDLPSMKEVLDLANTRTSLTPADHSTSSAMSSAATSTDASSDAATCIVSDVSASPSQGTSKRSLGIHRQRFSTIHSRRSFLSDMTKHKRDGMPTSIESLTPTERSITKGYSDGYLTAKIFAQYGMSKLGFTGQYIDDSIAALGETIVAPGTEEYYDAWFSRGLSDAGTLISAAVNN
ncbi:glycoside hydrolase superfamily [Phellopilus nigrolimitatus]|nr:glycoside hydrolase superfamily [Phellopilus nigrolimitatus]